MSTHTATAWAALVLDVVGLLAVFGVRSWLHRRRTGTSGFNGISGAPGSAQWWGGVLFVLALALGLLAPIAVILRVRTPVTTPLSAVTSGVGMMLLLVGLIGVLLAQTGMGSSWRIGVRDDEETDLVTHGLFSWARNPIFTAMLVAQAGLALMVPSGLALLAFACLLTAVQLQVRLIEEPFLRRQHGAAYLDYATRTGRFVPRVGRISS